MVDDSHLDAKYFINSRIYNCPFCKRRHVAYSNLGYQTFNWSREKKCHIWRIQCDSCERVSMHLTYNNIYLRSSTGTYHQDFATNVELDDQFFYSVPTSYFVLDSRIPAGVREAVDEAESCRKMNLLTGASACARKAIYELLVFEGVEGPHYEDRIKALKDKYPAVDPELFDILASIQQMTSDKVHEQSWDKWDNQHLQLILETLKATLQDMYVTPAEKKERYAKVKKLHSTVFGGDGASADPPPEEPA